MRGAVFYFTKVQEKRANEQFENILYGYDLMGIKCIQIRKSLHLIVATFENGDRWDLLYPSENMKARKFNISYVPHEPDEDKIILVKAITMALPYNGIIYY